MRKPNFFLVGAPKCGTTAMVHYLRQHPEVFIPECKEPNFFGRDLDPKYPYVVRNEEAYLALFAEAESELRLGEATVWYLYSRSAAGEIHSFNPDAKILVMLREPSEMLYSLHSQLLFAGDEQIPDFAEALAAEPERRAGRRVPRGAPFPAALRYREMACYTEQVERYFDRFGRERVHLILFDDFRREPLRAFWNTCRFLGVDPDFEPDIRVVNANRRIHSHRLHRFLIHPPDAIADVIRKFLPESVRRRAVDTLLDANVRVHPRPPLDPALKRQLRTEFAEEVARLERLLGRDLSSWKPDEAQGAVA